jgi:hypothetical protein
VLTEAVRKFQKKNFIVHGTEDSAPDSHIFAQAVFAVQQIQNDKKGSWTKWIDVYPSK